MEFRLQLAAAGWRLQMSGECDFRLSLKGIPGDLGRALIVSTLGSLPILRCLCVVSC